MIFPPGNPSDPGIWAAIFAGHMALGLMLTAICAVTLGRLFGQAVTAGAQIAVVGYALVWEVIVQRVAAGIGDAALDTFAVALGAMIGVAAWEKRGGFVAAGIAAAILALWRGIGRRM